MGQMIKQTWEATDRFPETIEHFTLAIWLNCIRHKQRMNRCCVVTLKHLVNWNTFASFHQRIVVSFVIVIERAPSLPKQPCRTAILTVVMKSSTFVGLTMIRIHWRVNTKNDSVS